jgi:hypothetical protein
MADLNKKKRMPAESYFNLEKTTSEMYKKLKNAFCGDTMSATQTFEWYSHFRCPYF